MQRLYTLLDREPQVHEILRAVAVEPPTWSALAAAYETIVGAMSTKPNPQGARSDYKNLVDKGWMSPEDSENFYFTAAYHKHGYPKEKNRAKTPMPHETARLFIRNLLWKFVDEKEPTYTNPHND